MGFFQFMASTSGRALRVVAGLAIIAAGLTIGGVGGTILAAVGVVPLAAGALDVCVLAPLFGGAFKGTELRAH